MVRRIEHQRNDPFLQIERVLGPEIIGHIQTEARRMLLQSGVAFLVMHQAPAGALDETVRPGTGMLLAVQPVSGHHIFMRADGAVQGNDGAEISIGSDPEGLRVHGHHVVQGRAGKHNAGRNGSVVPAARAQQRRNVPHGKRNPGRRKYTVYGSVLVRIIHAVETGGQAGVVIVHNQAGGAGQEEVIGVQKQDKVA